LSIRVLVFILGSLVLVLKLIKLCTFDCIFLSIFQTVVNTAVSSESEDTGNAGSKEAIDIDSENNEDENVQKSAAVEPQNDDDKYDSTSSAGLESKFQNTDVESDKKKKHTNKSKPLSVPTSNPDEQSNGKQKPSGSKQRRDTGSTADVNNTLTVSVTGDKKDTDSNYQVRTVYFAWRVGTVHILIVGRRLAV